MFSMWPHCQHGDTQLFSAKWRLEMAECSAVEVCKYFFMRVSGRCFYPTGQRREDTQGKPVSPSLDEDQTALTLNKTLECCMRLL